RLASPPQLDQELFQATARLRQSRGAAGGKMARKIQQRWPFDMARASLWERCHRDSFCAVQNISWSVGQRSIPVRLRAVVGPAVVIDPHARVVLPTDVIRFSDRAWGIVGVASLVDLAAPYRRIADADPGSLRRQESNLPS